MGGIRSQLNLMGSRLNGLGLGIMTYRPVPFRQAGSVLLHPVGLREMICKPVEMESFLLGTSHKLKHLRHSYHSAKPSTSRSPLGLFPYQRDRTLRCNLSQALVETTVLETSIAAVCTRAPIGVQPEKHSWPVLVVAILGTAASQRFLW